MKCRFEFQVPQSTCWLEETQNRKKPQKIHGNGALEREKPKLTVSHICDWNGGKMLKMRPIFFTPFFPAETFQHFTSGGKRASNAELVAFMRKVSLSAFQKKTSQRGKELRRQQCHTNKSAERETAWKFQMNSSGTKPRKWTRYDFRTKRSSHPRASCSRNHSRGAGKFAGN